jgi:hypothetical protein
MRKALVILLIAAASLPVTGCQRPKRVRRSIPDETAKSTEKANALGTENKARVSSIKEVVKADTEASALISSSNLSAEESNKLALTNVRSTFGVLGPARRDDKVLPGDSYVLSFDIEGVKVADDGKVLYSVGMEVTDRGGKVQFKQDPSDLEAKAALGGSSLEGFAMVNIAPEQPAGKYILKVFVTDRATHQSTSLSHEYETLPKAFGLIHLTMTLDPEGKITAPFLSQGESAWINFTAVGFGRDKTTQQPNLEVNLRALDANGKPTLPKSFSGLVDKDIAANADTIHLQFDLDLNRAGKFTIELKANDKVTGKEATLSMPITVLKAK